MASDTIKSNTLSGTATLLRAGKTEVSFVHVLNTEAAASFLQLFDAATAASVNVGTTIPDYVVKSAASSPDGEMQINVTLQLGLVVASTTTMLGSTGAVQHVRIGTR